MHALYTKAKVLFFFNLEERYKSKGKVTFRWNRNRKFCTSYITPLPCHHDSRRPEEPQAASANEPFPATHKIRTFSTALREEEGDGTGDGESLDSN